jgi:hypothetical protein
VLLGEVEGCAEVFGDEADAELGGCHYCRSRLGSDVGDGRVCVVGRERDVDFTN